MKNFKYKINILFIIIILFLSYFPLVAQENQKYDSNIIDNKTRQIDVDPETDRKTEISNSSQNIYESEKDQPVKNKNFNFSLSAGIGILKGHTTYQIGGEIDTPEGSDNIHFPLSELIFPLNTYLASIEASIQYIEKLETNVKIQTNIKEETDNMKDSDWGIPWEDPPDSDIYYWYGPDHLDIYSESKTDLRAFICDIDFLFKFYKQTSKNLFLINFQLFAGLGYIYQQYKFECRLIQQWDYRDDAPVQQDAVGDGKVGLTYDVFTHIPYIKIGTNVGIKSKYLIEASIGYSPYVKLEDKDNHVLRSKISKAKCEGDAMLFSIVGRFDIYTSCFIQLQFDYLSIDTKGKQNQYEDDTWLGTIDQKNFSKRKSVEFSIGYNF